MISELLLISSTTLLGVFTGTQITEAILFVPWWKSLSADEFFSFYKTHGRKIHRFYAPITILTVLLSLSTTSYLMISGNLPIIPLMIISITTLIYFSTYYLYFRKANDQFIQRSISDNELKTALITWGIWHWLRVGLEVLALLTHVVLLMK